MTSYVHPQTPLPFYSVEHASHSRPSSPYNASYVAGKPELHLNEGPPQFKSAMELVQRLQEQLKTVRLDKGRLEERCFALEQEVGEISQHLLASKPVRTNKLSPSFGSPTFAGSAYHPKIENGPYLENPSAKEWASKDSLRARLVSVEAQLASRDKEVLSLQKRLDKALRALAAAESKHLEDLSRLFRGSARTGENNGERAKWKREVKLALREAVRWRCEVERVTGRAGGEEGGADEGEGGGAPTVLKVTGLGVKRARREGKRVTPALQERIAKQAGAMESEKREVRALEARLERALRQKEKYKERLVASRGAALALKQELASLAGRPEVLEDDLRGSVGGAPTRGQGGGACLAGGERAFHGGRGEGGEWDGGKGGNRVGGKQGRGQEGRESGRISETQQLHNRRRGGRLLRAEADAENQDANGESQRDLDACSRRRQKKPHRKRQDPPVGNTEPIPLTPLAIKPQAWEINFPPGQAGFEISPVLHRFQKYGRTEGRGGQK
ncbi:hypothetical protein Naga_100102g7 [Nannochloropsis gaditana]|uniref:Uncharacterized protein n=1 Tax=Nannochloropsis gaditana TaxID=72520 RepID=W7T9D5_9STRA|nr:hypothetical protein Naga_100102g7 [Nannochloropsis gaditana]